MTLNKTAKYLPEIVRKAKFQSYKMMKVVISLQEGGEVQVELGIWIPIRKTFKIIKNYVLILI